jgi:hypothetical protein
VARRPYVPSYERLRRECANDRRTFLAILATQDISEAHVHANARLLALELVVPTPRKRGQP